MTITEIESVDFAEHTIDVVASRINENSKWTVKVDVTLPNGDNFPTLDVRNQSFETLNDAFESGFESGRGLVKNSNKER